jgi:hypothetical protein
MPTLNGCACRQDSRLTCCLPRAVEYLETPFLASASGASKRFSDIVSAQELFEWLRGPFISTTYPSDPLVSSSAPKSNHIVGGIRIGQLRVKAANCSSRVTPFFSWTGDTYSCYGSGEGDFQPSSEAVDPIHDAYVFQGLNNTNTDTERAAFFSTMSVSSAQQSLPAPAFSVVLPRSNGVEASSVLVALENSGYVDGQTRAVMLDLSVFNVMLRHVAALRFLVELPASGGAVTSLSAGVAPLTSSFLLDPDHWLVSACHIAVVAFYAYFFLDEVLALARSHSRQWQHRAIWHRSNLKKATSEGEGRPSPLLRRHGAGVRFLGLLCYGVTWLLRLVALVKRPSNLPLNSDEFVSLRPYVETYRAAQLALSACVCLAWIELLLMLRVSLHVDLIVRAVVCAAPQLLVLIVMVALVVMGYASACLVVFGAESSLFQSVPEALRSLLAILLQTGSGAASGSSLLGSSSAYAGEVGYDAAGTSTLRTLLLACFLLFNAFVAANLFLVIVHEGYLKAKQEISIDRMWLQPRTKFLARYRDDDERLEAAAMHLDLRREVVEYAAVVGTKVVNLVPLPLTRLITRRKGAEMQSAVLPADVPPQLDLKASPEQEESEDEEIDNTSPSFARRRANAKYARGSRDPTPGADPYQRFTRGGSRERSSANTALLEGMVLQLALQNEALLRAVNELKQDVQSLQRGSEDASDRDVLRRAVAQPIPVRASKQRTTSTVAAGSTLVDAPNNQLL